MRRNQGDDENPFDRLGDLETRMDELTNDGSTPVDVHEYDDRIEVVADVPGVDPEDVDLRCDGRTIAIRVATESGPFTKRVDLPSYVDGDSSGVQYNNGVLQVTLERTTDPANIGYY